MGDFKWLQVLALAAFGVAGLGHAARAADAPTNGEMDVALQLPDGGPAAGLDVHVIRVGASHPDEPKVDVTVRTDARGVAHLPWPAGVSQMKVRVKGVGFGLSGLVEVMPGKPTAVTLPALSPYGHLEGDVVPGEAVSIVVPDYFDGVHTAVADAAGHFRIEVPGGEWTVYGERNGTRVLQSPHAVYVPPGGTTAIPAMVAVPRSAESPAPPIAGNGAPPASAATKPDLAVRGALRDSAGKPVANATVFGVAVYDGFHGPYEVTTTALSDAAGRSYQLEEPYEDLESYSVMAVVPGRAPAYAWLRPERAAVDLVLPDGSGSMDVKVLADGKPLAKAGVDLATGERPRARSDWAQRDDGAHAEALRIAFPYATTDERGVAHFVNLLPGRYNIRAGLADEKTLGGLRGFSMGPAIGLAKADGVAVRTGETTRFGVGVIEESRSARVKAFRADGAVMELNTADFEFSRLDARVGTDGPRLINEGRSGLVFGGPGLWNAELRYRESPVQWHPVQEPYLAAAGVLAVSELMPQWYEPQWHARHFDSGSLRVRLLDPAGRPVRGVVRLGQVWDGVMAEASTDSNGEVLFDHPDCHLSKDFDVRAIGTLAPPGLSLYDNDSPLPTDDVLLRPCLTPQVAALETNREVLLTMQAQTAAWIRGTLPIAPGTNIFGLQIYSGNVYHRLRGAFNMATNEYLIGPFTGSKAKITVAYGTRDGDSERTQEVALQPGKVTHFDLALPDPPGKDSRGRPMATAGEIAFRPDAVATGQIFLADGKTPALGAQVFYFPAERLTPTLLGLVDATGNIRTGTFNRYTDNSPIPEGGPAGPVAVALLPGSVGAAVVPLENPATALRINLPAARSATGTVKVGPDAPPAKARVRVLAAYQGQGKLNGVLSVETSADLDGHFELAGLTPGTYQVQAALDDIWVSEMQVLRVGDQPLAPLQMTIPPPGVPTVVKVVDRAGKAVPGALLTVDRPVGPMGELWPAQWSTDGAGLLNIPTLEAGGHTVRLRDSKVSKDFTVPALPSEKPVEIELTTGR